MKYCFKCGKQMEDGSKFCRYCGTAQPETAGAQVSQNVQGNFSENGGGMQVDVSRVTGVAKQAAKAISRNITASNTTGEMELSSWGGGLSSLDPTNLAKSAAGSVGRAAVGAAKNAATGAAKKAVNYTSGYPHGYVPLKAQENAPQKKKSNIGILLVLAVILAAVVLSAIYIMP